MSLHSIDGEMVSGRYRFAREGTGLIQVFGPDGELLSGKFSQVSRAGFVESYKKIFGSGSITVYGPDVSAYGGGFGAAFVGSYTPRETAHGESFNKASGKSSIAVRGPFFYRKASLRGDRGTIMECYFIGSSYTGHGFGRCKSDKGKEYSVEF
jgi:hypothetical protein